MRERDEARDKDSLRMRERERNEDGHTFIERDIV